MTGILFLAVLALWLDTVNKGLRINSGSGMLRKKTAWRGKWIKDYFRLRQNFLRKK